MGCSFFMPVVRAKRAPRFRFQSGAAPMYGFWLLIDPPHGQIGVDLFQQVSHG